MNGPASVPAAARFTQAQTAHCYSAYGLRVRSTIPLTVPELPEESGFDIDILPGDSAFFEESIQNLARSADWANGRRLSTRWLHTRFGEGFEFLISGDGSQIFYRSSSGSAAASSEAYLLGALMKIVLVKKGIQSLHASSVIVDDQAVAFLGSSGFGKSSLAACFVSAGYPLLTDDVLRLQEDAGRMWAYPGPACLKLLPKNARQWVREPEAGVPMDPDADKWLYRLTAELQCQGRSPLAAIYCVAGPERARDAKQTVIETLKPREALQEILEGAHKDILDDRDRSLQLFDAAERVVTMVPVRRVIYPWSLASLPETREGILADFRGL